MQIILTDRAIDDINIAKKWYNEQQINLGFKFAEYIFKCLESISSNPGGFPSKYKYTREMVIRKYPYIIIYSIEEDKIFILRVFPGKKSPNTKYRRITKK